MRLMSTDRARAAEIYKEMGEEISSSASSTESARTRISRVAVAGADADKAHDRAQQSSSRLGEPGSRTKTRIQRQAESG